MRSAWESAAACPWPHAQSHAGPAGRAAGLWRAPRPPSSPRPAWPRSRPRCSRCCKAATRSWSTRSSRHGLHAVHAGPGALGVRAVFADFTRPETVAAAIGPTRACISRRRPIPTRLVDIQAVSAIARGRIVDHRRQHLRHAGAQRPWRWAPTWCCIRPPSTWAAMATCWPVPWPAARNWSTRCACKGCATTRRDAVALHRSPGGLKTLELRVTANRRCACAAAASIRRWPMCSTGPGRHGWRRDRAPPAIGRRRLVAFELKGGLRAGVCSMA